MSRQATTAIFPGTFDPVTYGHLDLIDRSLRIFRHVIVAVAESQAKDPLFSMEERLGMLKKTLGRRKNVSVQSFSGLVVRYARKKKAMVLIRGVRMLSDFEYEFQMALTNRKLDSKVETLFLMPNESYAYLTSRHIKEIALMGGDVSNYVPANVYQKLKQLRKKS